MTRFDITVSYQLSRVPGLLDVKAAKDLNELTESFLEDYLKHKKPALKFFIDHVELKSQATIEYEEEEADKNSPAEFVDLWVDVAVRGFTFNITEHETKEKLLGAIDSRGYSNEIKNSGNPYFLQAYAFSAAEKAEQGVVPTAEDVDDDEGTALAAIVVMVVIFIGIAAFAIGAYLYHKRSPNGLPCCRWFRRRPKVMEEERDLQSPESVNVLSNVGSMFSFDDTATAGTNGLMRFIGSFSRGDDSTSPSTGGSVGPSPSHDENNGILPYDEELGVTIGNSDRLEEQSGSEEEEEEEEEEPHPLAGVIPPMVVYDNIDEDENAEVDDFRMCDRRQRNHPRDRAPGVVPSRRVEASSVFIASISNRQRPTATQDLAEFLRYVKYVCFISWNTKETYQNSFLIKLYP